MKIRTIDNSQSRYFILDEYMAEGRTKPDILAVRESDGHVVVAHGWDETKEEWDYGNYYGDSSEALQKAAGDFGAIKEAYTELEASGDFETYADDYIDPRDLKQAIDFVRGTDQRTEIIASSDEIYKLKLNLVKEYFDGMTEYDFTDGGSGMPSRLYMETMAHQFEFDVDNFSDYIDELNQEVSRDYKPIVRIPHGMDTNQLIWMMDDEVQQNIKRALREKEIYEGHRGSELEELVEEAMSNRLSSIDDNLTVIEEREPMEDMSEDKTIVARQYEQHLRRVTQAEDYIEDLEEEMKKHSIDDSYYQEIQYELSNSAHAVLKNVMEEKEKFLKKHLEFSVTEDPNIQNEEPGEKNDMRAKTPEELKEEMKALGYEFEKEDFFIMFKDTETGNEVGFDGWEGVQHVADEIQSVACRYSIEELKAWQAGNLSVLAFSDHSDDVIDRALLLKEKIGLEKISNLSFNEKKEIFKGMTCEEQFKTMLETEMPETEGNRQLQDSLYASYMEGPQDSFLDRGLRKDLSESIRQFMEDKTKQKGVELE